MFTVQQWSDLRDCVTDRISRLQDLGAASPAHRDYVHEMIGELQPILHVIDTHVNGTCKCKPTTDEES